MNRSLQQRVHGINALAWAGSMGVVGMAALSVMQEGPIAVGGRFGIIFSAVLLGLMLLSERGLRVSAIVAALIAGTSSLWGLPLFNVFNASLLTLSAQLDGQAASLVSRLALPMTIMSVSLVLGVLMKQATGSTAVATQAILAGAVAAVCPFAPGSPVLATESAGALWHLIIFLSLATWARDYASRASRSSRAVLLGQEGPLVSLARGSTQPPVGREVA